MRTFSLSLLMLTFITGMFISCRKVTDNGTVKDIDGNVYHTVKIGTQVWMVGNVRTIRLNNGAAIPLVTDNTAWGNLISPGYCWYNNDGEASYRNKYGALYNWYAVNTGKLAPAGWHVATDTEWNILIGFLGGDSIAGGEMKTIGSLEQGTGLWEEPNIRASNKSGFSALSGGIKYTNGICHLAGELGYWWSPSLISPYDWWHGIYSSSSIVDNGICGENCGLSVRCIKD